MLSVSLPEHLLELGTNVVVTSSKETICRVFMNLQPGIKIGEGVLHQWYIKAIKIQRDMSSSELNTLNRFGTLAVCGH